MKLYVVLLVVVVAFSFVSGQKSMLEEQEDDVSIRMRILKNLWV